MDPTKPHRPQTFEPNGPLPLRVQLHLAGQHLRMAENNPDRKRRWPHGSDGAIDKRQALSVVASSFPSLDAAPGLRPFEANVFLAWLCEQHGWDQNLLQAGLFILGLYDRSADWSDVAQGLGVPHAETLDGQGRFDLFASVWSWDRAHRIAFFNWFVAPFLL